MHGTKSWQIPWKRHTSIGKPIGFGVWRGAFNAAESTSKDCTVGPGLVRIIERLDNGKEQS